MKVFEDAWQREDLPRGGVVTIGNFDGVHRGQRELIARVRARAAELGAPALVVTFDPHPMKVLRPEGAPLCLTTARQRERLLGETGVDAVAVIRFTASFARTTAQRFVDGFLVGRLAVVEVHVGSRFTFGRDREGSLEFLTERGAELGFEAHGVPEVIDGGEPISSTRIRGLVAAGEVEEAGRLLGRAYLVAGRVESGEGRGRELGWPTANLSPVNELFPGNGVYATGAMLDGESTCRKSITNVGVRPTFGGGADPVIECHLLDFEGDLYERRVELAFRRRLRGERRFGSPEELVEQIQRDVDGAREYFAAGPC